MTKKKIWDKTDISTALLCIAPVLAGAAVYNRLPQRIPVHFDINFNTDSWADKNFMLFAIPVMMAAFQLICCAFSRLNNEDKAGSKKILLLVKLIIPVLTFVFYFTIVGFSMGIIKDVSFIILGLLSLMFIIIGNYMPKIRANSVVGIRMPWTVHNEKVWNKTHRFAGKLWVVTGFVIMLFAFLKWFEAAIIIIVLCGAVVPLLYSYREYKKSPE